MQLSHTVECVLSVNHSVHSLLCANTPQEHVNLIECCGSEVEGCWERKQLFPLRLETDEQSVEEVVSGTRQHLGSLCTMKGEVLFDWHTNVAFPSKLELPP